MVACACYFFTGLILVCALGFESFMSRQNNSFSLYILMAHFFVSRADDFFNLLARTFGRLACCLI